MRVVFDVNFLIRVALRSRSSAHLLRASLESGISILVSTELRDEFAETARKPHLSGRIDWGVYNQILDTLESACPWIPLQPPYPACRDPDDGYLLALATAGDADFLVTSELDLLCMGAFGRCQIVTPERFRVILESKP